MRPENKRIKSIRCCQPERVLSDANMLIPEANENIAKYMHALERWKYNDNLWTDAVYYAQTEMNDAIEYTGRQAASTRALRILKGTELQYTDCEWYLSWHMVKDVPGFEDNPFDYIVQLYEMGLKPVGFRKVDGCERYVVDFPLIVDGERMLGCYAYGDKEILWVHEWKDDCTNLRPAKPHNRSVEYILSK